MKNMVKEKKGITLIALVITIIVLLILTRISIGQLSGDKNSITESKDKTALLDLTKIQQAVMETYIKYKQLGNPMILNGTQITYAEALSKFNQLECSESLKVDSYDGITEIDPSRFYYKIQKTDLTNMGLGNINNNDEYIVNYSSGEVFKITQKKTTNNEVLYIYAKEVEPEYVKSGLILHYDGINNTGKGDSNHSSTTNIWKDLSGNGNDGTINNATLGNNYVQLDGQQSWVNCGEINNETTTLEVVLEVNSFAIDNGDRFRIFGNWHTGGCGLYTNASNYIISDVYINGWKSANTSNNANILINKKYSITMTFDGHNEIIYINGINKVSQAYEGVIQPSRNNTVMALGCNPGGELAEGDFLNGRLYSARIYNRALTDLEVAHNYEIDKTRFEIEE